jgi:SAM-dependent methyltransferase
MVRLDVTALDFRDSTFDVVYCSHVLEHVSDDRRALTEIRRVLKPQGWALPLVPITAAKTFEDPAVEDPAERLRLFGQSDHVRCYGPDYVDRLHEAGFEVTATSPADLVSSEDRIVMGLTDASGLIFCCTVGNQAV